MPVSDEDYKREVDAREARVRNNIDNVYNRTYKDLNETEKNAYARTLNIQAGDPNAPRGRHQPKKVTQEELENSINEKIKKNRAGAIKEMEIVKTLPQQRELGKKFDKIDDDIRNVVGLADHLSPVPIGTIINGTMDLVRGRNPITHNKF